MRKKDESDYEAERLIDLIASDSLNDEINVELVAQSLRSARAEALEEAAKVAENAGMLVVNGRKADGFTIASRIRALKDTK
jgi:hypothetical protein